MGRESGRLLLVWNRSFLLTSLQPFNEGYKWLNTSQNMIVANPSITEMNVYMGSATQQATSLVTSTNQLCYELVNSCYSVYGFEVCSFLALLSQILKYCTSTVQIWLRRRREFLRLQSFRSSTHGWLVYHLDL